MNIIQRPQIPPKEELYDELMGKIESDLTRNQLPLLEKKYAGESEAEQKARMERYTVAFQKFYEALNAFFSDLNKQIDHYKKIAMKSAETTVQAKEQEKLSSLESMFSS